MLRGLDTADGDPDRVVVQVAGREALDGRLRVYLRSGVSAVVGERQSRVRETIGQLEGAGVVADVEVTEWPDRVRTPADSGVEADVVALYDEFVEAVGTEPLHPFFETRSATGSHGRVLELPAICVTYRTDDGLAGLYPRWRDGDHHSVENCLEALCSGDRVANVRSD